MRLRTFQSLLLILCSSLLILSFAFSANPVSAAIFTVTNVNDAGGGSLRAAILLANATGVSDTIQFDAALAGQTIPLAAVLPAPTNDLEIDGANAPGLVINGGGAARIFEVTAAVNVTLRNLTLQNGFSAQGAAIFNNGGALTLANMTITGNNGTNGPALYNAAGTVQVTGSTLSNNNATGGGSLGGAIFNNGTVTISNSTIAGNSAAGDGGGIFNLNTLTIANSTVSGNNATGAGTGGGVAHTGGVFNASFTTFTGNQSPNNGQAIVITGGTTTASCNNIQGNGAGAPNAVANNTATSQDFTRNFWGAADGPGGAAPGSGDTVSANIDFSDFLTATATAANCSVSGAQTPAAQPPPPTCNLLSGDGFNASGITADGVYCLGLMRNGAWQNGQVGSVPAELVNNDVSVALEVFRIVDGRSVATFPGYQKICLEGAGTFMYLDARNMPRYPIEMQSTSESGFECAWIPGPGTIALVQGQG